MGKKKKIIIVVAGAVAVVNAVYSNLASIKMDRSGIAGVIDVSGMNLYSGSPVANNPACFIIHGTKDTTDPFSKSEELKDTLNKMGISCTLYPLEGLNHDISTKYDVFLKQSAIFMYKQLTGKDVDITFTGVINPEIQKIMDRQSNNPSYTAKNMKVALDGKLDEWSGCEAIDLKQLKDAGTVIPSADDFSGSVKIAWDNDNPTMVYIAATITDDIIVNKVSATDKWYNDDSLEIGFDLSNEKNSEQILKWVLGAEGNDMSVVANKENMQVVSEKNGTTTNYEIAIDLSKIDKSMLTDFSSTNLYSGKCVGFSFAYDDSDNGTRKQQIGWISGKFSDRATFGNLYFE